MFNSNDLTNISPFSRNIWQNLLCSNFFVLCAGDHSFEYRPWQHLFRLKWSFWVPTANAGLVLEMKLYSQCGVCSLLCVSLLFALCFIVISFGSHCYSLYVFCLFLRTNQSFYVFIVNFRLVFMFCMFWFLFCVFRAFVLFCILFLIMYLFVSFLFVYKFTDHYRREET